MLVFVLSLWVCHRLRCDLERNGLFDIQPEGHGYCFNINDGGYMHVIENFFKAKPWGAGERT